MALIVAIIEHTPIWVFPLILLVLLMAGRNLRRRTVSVQRLFIFPVVLILLSLANAAGTQLPPAAALAIWVTSAAIGAGIGWIIAKPPLLVDRLAGRLEISGSVLPLLVTLGIVLTRYYFGYLFGRYPELQSEPGYTMVLVASVAFLGGVTLGRYGHLGYWYRQSPADGVPALSGAGSS